MANIEQARKTRHMNSGSVMAGKGSKTVVDISSSSDDDDAAYSLPNHMNAVFEFDEETEKNGDDSNTGDTVKTCSKGNVEKQGILGVKMENLNDEFRVGDFVWGKIKSHPWFPGQIYDSKDASAFAVKHSQEDRILVAYFGDGSCSWCLPSQIVPFVENFKQMSSDISSNNLMNAIQSALTDISRLVEDSMTCKCVPPDRRDGLAKPMASNAGVKKGVLVPDVDISRISVPEYCSNRVFEALTGYAKCLSVDCLLELSVLKSWLSAFYRARGGRYRLPVYCEPVGIEGLEDMTKKASVKSEILLLGLNEDGCKKSVSEPIGENSDLKRAIVVKEEKGMRKGVDSSNGNASRKRMEIVVAEANEELEIISSPRERKRSKYLSPPYTSLQWSRGKLGSERSLTKTEHSGSLHSRSMSDVVSSDEEKMPTIQTSESCKKLSFSAFDVDLQVDELLLEVQFAAVDCLYLSKKGSLETVWAFLSALRDSTYSSGADYATYQKFINKKLSLENQVIIDDSAKAPKSVLEIKGEGKRQKTLKTKVSTGLILTFAPGFPLPSVEEIVSLFGTFGRLNKKETNVMPESYSVQIVYMKKSDAEVAFKSSVAECPFGAENVKYWLQRSSANSNSNSKQLCLKIPEEIDGFLNDVSVIKQKLEIMTSILVNCRSKFSAEEKSSLEDEMKKLAKNVDMVNEMVRVTAENCS